MFSEVEYDQLSEIDILYTPSYEGEYLIVYAELKECGSQAGIRDGQWLNINVKVSLLDMPVFDLGLSAGPGKNSTWLVSIFVWLPADGKS